MAHHTLKSGYPQLVDRLNRFPQGAPPSETLYKILAMLFSEREAGLVALLPIKPFTAEQASRVWKLDLVDDAEGAGHARRTGDPGGCGAGRAFGLHPAAADGRASSSSR